MIAIVGAACFFMACAPGDPEVVQLPHDWRPGTRYHVELHRSREAFEGDLPPKISSARTPIDVEVLARRDDGYTLRWKFGRPDPAPEENIDSRLADQIAGLVEGLVMDFVTDATGSATALVDPAAMEAHCDAAAREMLAQMRGSKAADADIMAVRTAAAGLSGQGFRTGYLQIATRFTMPSGAALVPGDERTYEDRLPNPFGGDPLPARGSLVLREVRQKEHEAVVVWRLSIDPAKAGPILDGSIREYARRIGQALPADAALAFDAIEDAATYVYDLETGIPKSVVSTRSTIMAGTRQIETLRYVVTPLPPRAQPPRAPPK